MTVIGNNYTPVVDRRNDWLTMLMLKRNIEEEEDDKLKKKWKLSYQWFIHRYKGYYEQ